MADASCLGDADTIIVMASGQQVPAAVAVLTMKRVWLCTFSLRVIPIALKPGIMPPFIISVRGALSWYLTMCSTSWCCWDSCGSASCRTWLGQEIVRQRVRRYPSRGRPRVSARKNRNPLWVSPVNPTATPVSRPSSRIVSRPVPRHRGDCLRRGSFDGSVIQVMLYPEYHEKYPCYLRRYWSALFCQHYLYNTTVH
jgi:hypothetical protein